MDCLVKDNQVYEEWLMRDNMGIVDPLGGDTICEQGFLGNVREERGLRRNRLLHLYVSGDGDFLYRLADLDQLRRACFGMSFDLPTLAPAVRIVVMAT